MNRRLTYLSNGVYCAIIIASLFLLSGCFGIPRAPIFPKAEAAKDAMDAAESVAPAPLYDPSGWLEWLGYAVVALGGLAIVVGIIVMVIILRNPDGFRIAAAGALSIVVGGVINFIGIHFFTIILCAMSIGILLGLSLVYLKRKALVVWAEKWLDSDINKDGVIGKMKRVAINEASRQPTLRMPAISALEPKV